MFTIAETKLDSSFPERQFLLPGMGKPLWLNSTSKKGGLLVFVNNNVPSKYFWSFHLPKDIQAIPFDKKLKRRKLVIFSI